MEAEDITSAIVYALSTPPRMQVIGIAISKNNPSISAIIGIDFSIRVRMSPISMQLECSRTDPGAPD